MTVTVTREARAADCPSERQLSRHSVLLDDPRVHRHLDGCPRCSRRLEELTLPGRLVQDGPTAALTVDDKRRLRAQLLRRAAEPLPETPGPGWRRWWLASAAPLLAVAAAAAVLPLRSEGPPVPALPPHEAPRLGQAAPVSPPPAFSKAVVHGQARARFARVRRAPDEMLRLDEGTVNVAVASLEPDERFRVVTTDAVVEVRGTAFDVSARGGRLTRVKVEHGRVEVTVGDGPGVPVDAGQTWRPAVVRPAPTGPTSGPGERELEEAWSALKSDAPAGAAAAFQRAGEAAGGSALAEDAWFWQAVALARAGQRASAREAWQRFLRRYPASPRAAEASVMLGWLLLEAGDLPGARARFQAASADPSPVVRDSAREGLRAAASKR